MAEDCEGIMKRYGKDCEGKEEGEGIFSATSADDGCGFSRMKG
jgi:hypothetical protein